MKTLFTTVRGWCLIFSILVSVLFLNAAVGVWRPEWSRYGDRIRENIISSTKVDRCVTCHTEPGRHPGAYLTNHPPERFGCTSCHGGAGRALTAAEAHAVGHSQMAIRTGADVQANCLNCHIEQFRVGDAAVLNEGKELLYEKRCVRCHQISSFAEAYPGLAGFYAASNLGRIASGMKPEWMYRFIKNPHAIAARTGMPYYGFRDDQVQTILAYLLEHQKAPESAFKPARLKSSSVKRGTALVQTLGCLGCHAVNGNGSPQAVESNLDLSYTGSFFSAEFLFDWLYSTGSGHRPAIPLEENEAYDVTAYLTTLKAPSEKETTVKAAAADRAEEGGRLIRENNCYGCHAIPGFEEVPPALPELSRIGDGILDGEEEVDLPRKKLLIRRMMNPKSVDADSRMPVIAMTPQEAEAIATALMGLKSEAAPEHLKKHLGEAEKAVQRADRMATHQFKCSLCHRLPWQQAAEQPPVTAPDLAATAEKLSIAAIAEKLSTPHKRQPNAARMPYYQLQDEEVLALIRAMRLR